MDEVRRIALEFANVLGSDPRTRHVHFDWMEPARQVRVRVDQDEARRLGVSSRGLAAVLNASVTGSTVTQLRDDIYLDQRRRARHRRPARFVRNAELAAGADAERTDGAAAGNSRPSAEDQEFPLVWRRDRVPTLTVRADVTHGVLPDVVVGALAPKVAEFAAKLPRPYTVATGGLYEESAASSASVFAVVPLMLVLMLTIMMLMLVSFRRLAMVVALLPLGLIGVVVTLLVFNRPLGFVAILGILALIGMIAKNAVILVVQIESDRADGKGRPGRRDGVSDLAAAADDPDGDLDRARLDPDRADGVLGTDGVRHHGRAARRDVADADPAAGALRHRVRERKDGRQPCPRRCDPEARRLTLEDAASATTGPSP